MNKNILRLIVLGIIITFKTQAQQEPIRINSGGDAITFEGNDYIADAYKSGGSTHYTGTSVFPVPYNTESFGTVTYNIPVVPGDYMVKLHFAEIWYGTPSGTGGSGSRVFDVDIENNTVLSQYDIYAESGNDLAVKEFNVTVNDNSLDIYFTSQRTGGVNNPKVSAIEVIPNCYNNPIIVEHKTNDDSWSTLESVGLNEGDQIRIGVDAYSNDFSLITIESPSRGSFQNYHTFENITAADAGTYTITHNTTGCSETLQINVNGSSGGGSGNSIWSESNSTASYSGEVAIGRSSVPSGYKLAVDGNIRTREIRVDQDSWPDYVFDNDYDLPTLKEVQKHVQENGHLPNIPSASEVEENGVELGEMNRLLLEKIEELTLYILQQEKRIIELENKQ